MLEMEVSWREPCARPPDPPVERPPRTNVRRVYIRRVDVENYGLGLRCLGCPTVPRRSVPTCIVATHNDERRERLEALNWSRSSLQN